MSYGAPTKLLTSSYLQCAIDTRSDGGSTGLSPKVVTSVAIYNPGVFKKDGQYYFYCAITLTGTATGTGTKLYLARNGLGIRINTSVLRNTNNTGSLELADTDWVDSNYYICGIGSTLNYSNNIEVILTLQSANDVESAQATASCSLTVYTKQLTYLSEIIFVGDSSISPGTNSVISAPVILPEGSRRVKGQVIHIKSTHPTKKVLIYSIDGTQFDANTYDFNFVQSATYSTSISQIDTNVFVMNEALAAVSIVYDGSTWRILSYYNGIPTSPYIAWGNAATTTNTITERLVAVDLSTKTGNYLLNIPDPAGPLKEVIVIASGYNSNAVVLCRNSYSVETNINQTLVVYPAAASKNACVRLISNGTQWYIISLFDGNGFTTFSDASALTPLTTVPSQPGFISLTGFGTVNTPVTIPDDGLSYLYHAKARFTTQTALTLTSYVNGGRICGVTATQAIQSTAKYCPCVVFAGQIIGTTRYYYIVSFFGGY